MLLLLKTDRHGLRTFGWQMAIAWPLLFSLLLPWLFGWAPPLWPLWLSAVFVLLAVGYPFGLYYPYRLWMAFASVMAWINTRLLLGLVFYLMILPLGLVLRLFGKLQYQHKPTGDSYWRTPDKLPLAKDLEDPF
ncbi:SxtJ family membrane protein [Arsukibacterium sp.]|uniref:SxtJ family membrane protein n=1 Tax=Arsukibacterium sp. TaxID=1977258 RepID=UPI002FDB1737